MKLNVKFEETQEKLSTVLGDDNKEFDVDFGSTTELVNPYAVLYTPQELTEEQQEQARINIGVEEYNLPIASQTTLGGVMIGEGLEIADDGTLSATVVGDKTFVFNQMSASEIWEIEHNLDKHPSVTIVDSAGTVVTGDVNYIDANNIQVTFIGAFSGTAYLN